MLFSYNWLQSFFKRKLPKPKKLAEILTLHFAEVEKIKKEGKDFVLDIDVRPNRAPDCFSHLGIAREISAICGFQYILPQNNVKEDQDKKVKNFLNVEVKSYSACQRYTARVIFGVRVGFSPRWLRERLKSCGLKSINNVVDIVNYVMLETGQPLHAFDFEKISGVQTQKPSFKTAEQNERRERSFRKSSIIVRKAKKGEKIVTLDDEKYDLDENVLVIADAKKPLAIAGIKGGKNASVDFNSKILILESANFDPRVIRQTSKKIDLKTDASWRFEHGISPNLTEFAINRAAFLIQEISGGKVAQGLIDFYPKKILPKTIQLDLDYVERLLGVKISQTEIQDILQKLGFKIKRSRSSQFKVEVPSWRMDVLRPEDLIEEIGRIYGYQKIPSVFATATLIPPQENLSIFWEEIIKNNLKEAEFTEVYNYSFVSKRDSELFSFSVDELVETENPLNLDYQYLRPSLIPNLLKNLQKNQKNFSEIKIFELGKTFKKPKIKNQKPKIEEKKMLTGVMVGDAFYELKGVIDLLLNKLGISNIWFADYQPTPEESKISIWHLKRCAEIKVDNEKIGFLGEISPQIISQLAIEKRVTVFDIDFDKLVKLASEEKEYRPISKYPAVIRDTSVLVPRRVRVEKVLNKIEGAGGPLISDIDLFDIYESEELPFGKKSLSFHIIYQAKDRVLSSKEIEEIQNKIIQVLEKEPQWQVRK